MTRIPHSDVHDPIRVGRAITVGTLGYLAVHWYLFVYLEKPGATTIKALAAAQFGSETAILLRDAGWHIPTVLFAVVAVALWRLRELAPAQAGPLQVLDRHAHWLMPAAFVLTLKEHTDLTKGFDPIEASRLFAEMLSLVLQAPQAVLSAWRCSVPYPDRWDIPFVYFVECVPLPWKTAGLLPFVALYALWRKTQRSAAHAEPAPHPLPLPSPRATAQLEPPKRRLLPRP